MRRFITWLAARLGLVPAQGTRQQGWLRVKDTVSRWDRQLLENALTDLVHNENRRGGNWFDDWYIAQQENRRLRIALESEMAKGCRNVNAALHMADLEAKNKQLKRTVRGMQVAAERHNLEAYATGLIVHCTGCERGQPFNGQELTEERVQEVERLAGRLRTWFDNHADRMERSNQTT